MAEYPLFTHARRDGSATALSFEGRHLTWQQLAGRVQAAMVKVDDCLRDAPGTPGYRISLSLDGIVGLHALLARGCTFVLLSPQAPRALVDTVRERYGLTSVIEAGDIAAAFTEVERHPLPPGNHSNAEVRVLTSGTTGAPKAVRLPFNHFAAHARAAAMHLGLTGDDRWLACLPPHHVGGLSVILRAMLLGNTVHVVSPFEAAAVNAAIDAGEITHASLVPTMLHRLLEARGDKPFPPSLKLLLLGGAGLAPALSERARRLRAPVAPSYGMSETCSQTATLPPPFFLAGIEGAGHPLPGVEISIRDAVGIALPPEKEGEIWVRGNTVTPGYVDAAGGPDANGWLHTGDIGAWIPREGLRVFERRSDLILSGGENVYPADVEQVLLAHPAVVDAGVVGLRHEEWGQAVAAAVVLRSDVGVDELRRWCRSRLSAYQIPRLVYVLDALPRTQGGKLRRSRLREMVMAP